MQAQQGTTKTNIAQSTGGIKRTLNLTSLTVNAMALIAPGAFLWTTFQLQAAQMNGAISTAGEMWTGLVARSFWHFSPPFLMPNSQTFIRKPAAVHLIISRKQPCSKKKRPVTGNMHALPNLSSAGFPTSITGYTPGSW